VIKARNALTLSQMQTMNEVVIICVQHRDGKIGQESTGNAVSHNYLQNELGAKILKHVAMMHRCKVGLE
jgi:hypothetical protein